MHSQDSLRDAESNWQFDSSFCHSRKTWLGGEHPDYDTPLSALMQILHGLVLNTWHNECDYLSLRDFANAEPTPGSLIDCAHQIIKKYASLEPAFKHMNSKVPHKDLGSGVKSTKPMVNTVHNNIVLLTYDLLCVTELVDTIASGDFGCIEDILSRTKVFVHDGLIQSHLVTRETSAGCIPLVSLPV